MAKPPISCVDKTFHSKLFRNCLLLQEQNNSSEKHNGVNIIHYTFAKLSLDCSSSLFNPKGMCISFYLSSRTRFISFSWCANETTWPILRFDAICVVYL